MVATKIKDCTKGNQNTTSKEWMVEDCLRRKKDWELA